MDAGRQIQADVNKIKASAELDWALCTGHRITSRFVYFYEIDSMLSFTSSPCCFDRHKYELLDTSTSLSSEYFIEINSNLAVCACVCVHVV